MTYYTIHAEKADKSVAPALISFEGRIAKDADMSAIYETLKDEGANDSTELSDALEDGALLEQLGIDDQAAVEALHHQVLLIKAHAEKLGAAHPDDEGK